MFGGDLIAVINEISPYADALKVLSGAQVMDTLDVIGGVHLQAAKRAIQDRNEEAAIGNLYAAYEAFTRRSQMNELACVFSSLLGEDAITKALADAGQVALLIALYYRHKNKPAQVSKYCAIALTTFQKYSRRVVLNYERTPPFSKIGQDRGDRPEGWLNEERKDLLGAIKKLKG